MVRSSSLAVAATVLLNNPATAKMNVKDPKDMAESAVKNAYFNVFAGLVTNKDAQGHNWFAKTPNARARGSDGRSFGFYETICDVMSAKNGRLIDVTRDALWNWDPKSGGANNKQFVKEYDSLMQNPFKDPAWGFTPSGDESVKGDKKIQKSFKDKRDKKWPSFPSLKMSDDTVASTVLDAFVYSGRNSKLNSPKGMAGALRNIHQAEENKKENKAVYLAFLKLIMKFENLWKTWRLLRAPFASTAKNKQSTGCSETTWSQLGIHNFRKTYDENTDFAQKNLPDLPLLLSFVHELEERDGTNGRVAGNTEGGVKIGAMAAWQLMRTTGSDDDLEKMVKEADSWLDQSVSGRLGDIQSRVRTDFWTALRKMAGGAGGCKACDYLEEAAEARLKGGCSKGGSSGGSGSGKGCDTDTPKPEPKPAAAPAAEKGGWSAAAISVLVISILLAVVAVGVLVYFCVGGGSRNVDEL